ncbi:MAG TPA: PQQ-binding-like beta-propeller repeat protein [Pyrinomonadaceae bacterium]|jgi:outer membrane protein assembly factor BamB
MEVKTGFGGRVRSCVALLAIFHLAAYPPNPLRAQGLTDLSRPVYAKWSYKTDAVTNLTPATDAEKVYMPLGDGSLVSIRLADGGLSWRSEIGGAISASPVADSKSVYVASESLPSPKSEYPQATGVLRALSRQSGLTSWMRTLPFPVRGDINLNDGSLFVTTSEGRLYAFSKESGEIKWIKYNSSPFSFLHSLRGEVLYTSDTSGDIIALAQDSGETLWRYRTRKALRAPVAAYGNVVYSGAADGYVFALDRLTGRYKWRVRTGAAVQTVLAAEKCILATSLDNFIYCLSPQNGVKVWKRQMPGRVAAPPLLINGSVLLAPLVGEDCVVLNLEDGKKINSIYVGEDKNTEAAPLNVADTLLLTTREGLSAFSNQSPKSRAADAP